MSFMQEFSSWFAPLKPPTSLANPPKTGDEAPSTMKTPFSATQAQPKIIVFLRHCGCPFAEKSFKAIRSAAAQHKDIKFIAVSHSDENATSKWLTAVGGPKEQDDSPEVEVIVDRERKLYAKWGLGATSWAHAISPGALMGAYSLGKEKGIWNRPTESGSRWQQSGAWSVDEKGVVKWGGPSSRADDTIDIDAAIESLKH